MINPQEFFEFLKTRGVSFFTGVPDSLLKDFCAYVMDHAAPEQHVIAANEGAAVALAAGHYLASKKPAVVYLQNSGLGNMVNPLVSLADPEVYSIPMLLLIGWRAEPGVHDEPQHIKQGRVMLKLLDTLEIPYRIIDEKTTDLPEVLTAAWKVMDNESRPFALVVKKNAFAPYASKNGQNPSYPHSREQAIEMVLARLGPADIVVSTTGMTSREVFEYREKKGQGHANDFLTVGSMGHCSQIALGIALQNKSRSVYCLDGDGSVLMHMGSLAITGCSGARNLKHIVFNNGAHDSVGGQPTVAMKVDLVEVAKACGYPLAMRASSADEIAAALLRLPSDGLAFLEIRVNKGARKDLGRPTTTPIQNKNDLMQRLSQ